MATRKRYDNRLKAQIALEAIKDQRTISEIASDYGIHPNQVGQWKKKLLDEVPDIFSGKGEKKQQDNEVIQNELYRQIGQLKVELDWLKKKAGLAR